MAKRKSHRTSTSSNKKKLNFKFKMEVPAIVGLGLLLIMLGIIYAKYGMVLTLILALGIGIIIGVANLYKKLRKHKKWHKVINVLLILFFLCAIAVCIAITGFCIYIVKVSPDFDITKLTKREASIIYANDNVTEIGRFGNELRENVSYDDLPEIFIDALIATEDSRFFQHNGFDAPRFIKASLGQASGNSGAGGASTLSMQLIKNTYTDTKLQRTKGLDGIIRKFEDIYLSVFKLEKNYTKEEIIEYYVNNYDLGNNSFGVEQASQTLFDKHVTDLNLTESALLAGIFNNPTQYNPFINPKKSESRRNTVLNLMVNHGYITREEADYAKSIPVESLLTSRKVDRDYQAYLDTVYEEIQKRYGISPNSTSLLIYTNMDINRQKGLDDIFNGKSNSYKWLNDKVQGAAAVVDVHTGKIVAIAQGRDRNKALMPNRASNSEWGRQIGSTAKPIIDYGPAIEYLNYSTYQQILDEPWKYSTGQVVGNSDGQFVGPISMRNALAQSRNIPALKTFQEVSKKVGNDKIKEFANNLGIYPETASDGTVYESASLGAFDGTTPLQMAAAYAAFSNGGTYYEPTTITKIVYRENNEVIENRIEGKRVMSEATAFMVTDMLLSAVNEGISGGAKVNGVNVAAKTGTTNFTAETLKRYKLPSGTVNDAWIVGFDPEYAIAMWYGYDKVSDGYSNQYVAVAQRGKLYNAIGTVIFNKNGATWTEPNSVQKICVEKGSNPAKLPSQYTPQDQITCEYFKKGDEPTEVSAAYNKLNPVTNLKVTYDEKAEKVNITWTKVETPSADESYGEFGYNVYYGDVLLGFTTENTYSIHANTNISGTYKVVTTFKNNTTTQSDPVIFKFDYVEPTPTPSPTTSPSPSTTPKPSPSPSPSQTTKPNTDTQTGDKQNKQ